jgi:RNA ligase (TIGR02306 family)
MKHEVRVVRIGEISPHPDPETVSLGLTVVSGYTLVVGLAHWKPGDLAVFVEPDYIIPEGVSWMPALEPDRKVRVKKLRGVFSPGCLIPLSDIPELTGVAEGDDVMERLGIIRYVDDGPPNPDEIVPDPELKLGLAPRSNLENWQKNKNKVSPDLEVQITEKINGKSGAFAFRDGKMWCGSRTQWLKEGAGEWWLFAKNNPWIVELCKANPDVVFYGEVYGTQKKFQYGLNAAKPQLRLFYGFSLDRLAYLNYDEFTALVPEDRRVPLLYKGRLGDANVEALAEGKSVLFPTQVREGCVITAVNEGYNPEIGRLALKCVGNGYLAKS